MPKDTTVELLIRVKEDLTASLRRINASLEETSAGARRLGQSLTWQVAAANLLSQALMRLGHDAVQQFKQMALASEEFRLRAIGIASQLTNLAAAGQGDYGQIFQRNLLFADRFYNALRRYDAEHASSLEEMLTLYDAFVQKGYQVRLEEAKALAELTDRIKLATAGQNFQIQAYQEIRAILEGTADIHSQIARELRERLGPSWHHILQQHREAGTLVKFIASQYPGITAAAKEFENTLEAQTTTLASQAKYLGREGLGGLYMMLVQSLKSVNVWLRENEAVIISILKHTSSFIQLLASVGQAILGAIVSPLKMAVDLTAKLAGLLSKTGLAGRARALARQAGEAGIEAGIVETPFGYRLQERIASQAELLRQAAEQQQQAAKQLAEQTEAAARPASEKAIEMQKDLAREIREIWLQTIQGPGAELIRWYESLTGKLAELLDKLRQVPELQKDIVYWEQQLTQARQAGLAAQEQQLRREYERWRAARMPGLPGRLQQLELEYREILERYGYRLVPGPGIEAGPTTKIPPHLREHFERLSREYRIPLELLARVAQYESGFRQDVVSRKGAIGIMQLMPGTAQQLGVNPYDLLQNLEGGARYLSQLYIQFGDWAKALAAYNWGPERVRRFGMERLPEETRQYLQRILGPGGVVGGTYELAPDLVRQQEILAVKEQELARLRQQAAVEYSQQLRNQLETLLSQTRNFEDELALRQQILELEHQIQKARLEQFINEQGLSEEQAQQLRQLQQQIQAVDQIGRLTRERRQEALREAAGVYRERMEMAWLPLQEREAAAEQYRRLREVQISYELEEMRRKYGQLMDEAVLRAYEATQREMVERQIGGALGAIALEWEAAWKRAAENVQDALANLLYNLMTQTRSARDILRSLVSSMLQILSQLAASAIIRGAGSLLGSAFGGLGLFSGLAGLFGGGGSTGFALGGAAQYTTGVSGLIPMLQHGGIVTKPTLAVVGEAGPEAVIPLSKMEPKGPDVEVQVVNVYDPAQIRQLALAALASPEGRTIIINTLQLDVSTGGMTRTFRR